MIDRRGLVLAISASLIVGCAIGLIAGVLFARTVMGPHMPGPPRFRGGPPREDIAMQMVVRRLGLTEEQTEHFHAIIERARAHADSLHEVAHAEIMAGLTPEQRERWATMEHRFGRRGGPFHRHGRHGPPPRPPDEP